MWWLGKQRSKNVFMRISISWVLTILVGCVITSLNPVGRITLEQAILRASCVLGMFVSRELLKIETSDGKPISHNLAILFACIGVLIFLTETDTVMIVIDVPFAGFYLNQYGNAIYNTLLLFFALFLVAHTFLARRSLSGKYFVVGVLSVACGVITYYPVIENPRYAYTAPEILDFVSIEREQQKLIKEGVSDPHPELIARSISLPRWNGSSRIGELSFEESLERVKQILPYTKGSNYANLVHAPLRVMGLRMNVLAACVVLILIIGNLTIDPPLGAYRDKLNLVFFIYMIFEITHGFVFQGIIEWDTFLRIDTIGKIVTTLIVLSLILVAFWRYKFLSKGVGRYYEARLANDPRSITRWRDGFDRIILRQFFKTDPHGRRFLQKTPTGDR